MSQKSIRCVIVDPATNNQLCTGIYINVPESLSYTEAVLFVTGLIAKEVSRYAAAESLSNFDWRK